MDIQYVIVNCPNCIQYTNKTPYNGHPLSIFKKRIFLVMYAAWYLDGNLEIGAHLGNQSLLFDLFKAFE